HRPGPPRTRSGRRGCRPARPATRRWRTGGLRTWDLRLAAVCRDAGMSICNGCPRARMARAAGPQGAEPLRTPDTAPVVWQAQTGDTIGRMSNSQHPGQEAQDEAMPGPAPAAGGGDAQGAGTRELHVNWFYGLFALVLLSLAFGAWGMWMVFGGGPGEDPVSLREQVDELEQRVTTLARSDQISRE